MVVRKRRDGRFEARVTSSSQFGGVRTFGPFPTRVEAQAAQVDARKEEADRAATWHDEFMAKIRKDGSMSIGMSGDIPFKPPGPSPAVAFMAERLVEIPGLPFVLNRWAVIAGPIGLLIFWSPQWGGLFSPLYYLSFVPMHMRAIIAAVVLSFASPLLWVPVGIVLVHVYSALEATVNFIVKLLAGILSLAFIFGLLALGVFIVYIAVKAYGSAHP